MRIEIEMMGGIGLPDRELDALVREIHALGQAVADLGLRETTPKNVVAVLGDLIEERADALDRLLEAAREAGRSEKDA